MIAHLLRQLSIERAGAIKSSQEAIAQLRTENSRLNEELSGYRQRELDEFERQDSDEDELPSDPPDQRPSRIILTPARRSSRTSSGSEAPTPRTPLRSPWSQNGSRVRFSGVEESV
jgi:hypothetical protein